MAVDYTTDDTQPIYERLKGEPGTWFAKFLLYRNIAANRRSLLGAYHLYQSQAQKGAKKLYTNVPQAWRIAAEKWDWKFRAEQYDAMLHKEAEERARVLREIEAAEIERILTEDYALMHKRIEALARMAHTIEDSMKDPETGEVNPKWVYPDKIREFRGCLDDIAKELGQRIKKNELTGKNGGPVEVEYLTNWGGGVVNEDE